MSSEQHQRQKVIRALAPLHAFSVENMVNPGTPDLVFIGGFLELKCVKAWPPRGGVLRGPVGRKHFTNLQRLFCRTWRRKEGFHSICLQVADEWFLLEPVAAAEHLGIDWTEQDIRDHAWWKSRPFDAVDFYNTIRDSTHMSKGWKP